MIDIHTFDNWPIEPKRRVLKAKYSFKFMPYLVADKYGNIFILPHCPNKRTIPFKQLNKSKGYIYYRGNKIRLQRLRSRAVLDIKDIDVY